MQAVFGFQLAKRLWRHSRLLFELTCQMCRRTVAKCVGNLTDGVLAIAQQLFSIFYTMLDGKVLDGHTLHLGEEFAQTTVVTVSDIAYIVRQFGPRAIHPDPLNHTNLYLF